MWEVKVAGIQGSKRSKPSSTAELPDTARSKEAAKKEELDLLQLIDFSIEKIDIVVGSGLP